MLVLTLLWRLLPGGSTWLRCGMQLAIVGIAGDVIADNDVRFLVSAVGLEAHKVDQERERPDFLRRHSGVLGADGHTHLWIAHGYERH